MNKLTIQNVADLVNKHVGSITHDLSTGNAWTSQGMFCTNDPLKTLKLGKCGEWLTGYGRCYHETRSSHIVWLSIPSFVNVDESDKVANTIEALSWAVLTREHKGILLTANKLLHGTQWFTWVAPFCEMSYLPTIHTASGQEHKHQYSLLMRNVPKSNVLNIKESLNDFIQ